MPSPCRLEKSYGKGRDWRCSHSRPRLCQHVYALPPGWLWQEFSNISKPSQLANVTATRGHSRLLHQRVARGCGSLWSLPVESTRSVWHGRSVATIQSFVLLIKTVSLSHSALSVQDFSEERGPFSPADNRINLMRSQQAVPHYLINCCLFQRRLWLQTAESKTRAGALVF